jgi:hypothetical protein
MTDLLDLDGVINIKDKIVRLADLSIGISDKTITNEIKAFEKHRELKGLINIEFNPFIYSDISQMSHEFNGYGVSACTAIATLMSIKLLNVLDNKKYNEINNKFISDNLREIMRKYISNFEENLNTEKKRKATVEEIDSEKKEAKTVEKVKKENPELQKFNNGFQSGSLLNTDDLNDIFNNVFSGSSRYVDLDAELSKTSFSSIQNSEFYEQQKFENINPKKYVALIITKVPETIAVLLPPPNSNRPFLLFDSHSRSLIPPTYTGAYIHFFKLQSELIKFIIERVYFTHPTDLFDAIAFQLL